MSGQARRKALSRGIRTSCEKVGVTASLSRTGVSSRTGMPGMWRSAASACRTCTR